MARCDVCWACAETMHTKRQGECHLLLERWTPAKPTVGSCRVPATCRQCSLAKATPMRAPKQRSGGTTINKTWQSGLQLRKRCHCNPGAHWTTRPELWTCHTSWMLVSTVPSALHNVHALTNSCTRIMHARACNTVRYAQLQGKALCTCHAQAVNCKVNDLRHVHVAEFPPCDRQLRGARLVPLHGCCHLTVMATTWT
jgi:hypothetical protein